jgi:hypothetical protein
MKTWILNSEVLRGINFGAAMYQRQFWDPVAFQS